MTHDFTAEAGIYNTIFGTTKSITLHLQYYGLYNETVNSSLVVHACTPIVDFDTLAASILPSDFHIH